MKTKICIILLFALALNACGNATSAPSTKETATTLPSSAPTDNVTEAAATKPATEIATQASSRKAVLSEVDKTVHAHATQDDKPAPASAGMAILPGGGVETGKDGRARLDLLPDGTIVRVGPNSSFTMPELTETDGAPLTTFELLYGKVYILLNGGSLNVKTPSGVASVRGSVMSVQYDPKTKRLKTACLEGHCAIKDEEGNEVELTDEEMSYIYEGEPPTEPEIVDNEEIQEWLDEVPEMPEFFEELPNPEDFPEPEFPEEPTFEPEATLDPGATPDPGTGGEPDPDGGEPDSDGGEPDSGGGEPDPGGIP